jgi:MFS family permease
MSDVAKLNPPAWLRSRELTSYPSSAQRRLNLLLVVAITVSLYYQLYVGGGVATLILPELRMPFDIFVLIIALGNLCGAFASLLVGLSDRYGRANLVVYGMVIVCALTFFAIPNAKDLVTYGIEYWALAFVEGVVLVATPALIRDFSPQVGRATAMGVWTVGPVLGSLMVSLVVTLTLPTFHTWQSQYRICGAIGFIVFVLAFLFLRELSPTLRDQVMVSMRDQALVEARARGLNLAVNLRAPFRQLMHPDIVVSALGVSVLLLFYYTAVAFGTIYLVTIFHWSVADANALSNWSWAINALGLVVVGVLSDRLGVRKPFMLVGGIGAVALTALYISQAGQHPSWWTMVAITCGQSALVAMGYVTWMASFTETVEARNPALTGTGLAIWGWIQRIVVTVAFLAIPHVVSTVTPLISSGPVLAAYQQAVAAHVPPSPALLAKLTELQQAAAASPGQWRTWYWICVGGIVVFLASIFLMRGRWRPAAARADQAAHDAAVAREMAHLRGSVAE